MTTQTSTRAVRGDGVILWSLPHGALHRVDGPAVIRPLEKQPGGHINPDDDDSIVGVREWWKNDYRHRVDGPAVIHPDGREEWWVADKLHRVDGPAITVPHDMWCIKGELVDVTRWDETLLQPDAENIHVGSLASHHIRSLESPKPENSTNLFVALNFIKNNMDEAMLTKTPMCMRYVAAWNAPADENYIDVALRNPFVFDMMQYRTDVPEHLRTYMEVVA